MIGQQVTTREQLDSLPIGARLTTHDGLAVEKLGADLWLVEAMEYGTDTLLGVDTFDGMPLLPATVVSGVQS